MQYYYEEKNEQQGYDLQQYIYDVNFFRFNWHSEFEVFILLRGSILFCVDGDNYKLSENDVVVASPNHGHAVISETVNSLGMIIHFSPDVFSSLSDKYKNIEIICRSNEENRNDILFKKIRHYAAQMMLAEISADERDKLVLRGGYYNLVGILLNSFPNRHTLIKENTHNEKNYKIIQKIARYMEKNYNKRIELANVAHAFKYNKNYLSTFFKTNVGIGFHDYLMKVRFRHALQELSTTEKSLTEIAYDCGFADLKTFSMYFKKQFHNPPNSYRGVLNADTKTKKLNASIYTTVGDGYSEKKLRSYIMFKEDRQYSKLIKEKQEESNALQKRNAEIAVLCKKILELTQD